MLSRIFHLFLIASYLSGSIDLSAQSCSFKRYQERVFNAVVTSNDLVYGNAPALILPYLGESFTYNTDLTFDLFEPAGDTLNKRPLVILAFGGGFLIGSKEDEDIQATCDSLAKRGYVTASINYRIGMDIINTKSAERAVYRGIQDFSAAIRYFKEYAATYRIDTNYIFAGGVSAGSISALHMAFADESDRYLSSYQSSFPFIAPDMGCKDCSGNNYNHSSTNIKALINCWGAIGNVNFIEQGEDIPLVSFHGDSDLVVPYDSGYPFSVLATMPYVYGSLPISTRANAIGLYNELYTFVGEGHNVWGTVVNNSFVGGPSQYMQPIIQSISDFLFIFLKPETAPIIGDTVVCANEIITYSTSETSGSAYCWDINGGTLVGSNPSSSSVDIQWDSIGVHQLNVIESSSFEAIGDTQSISVLVNGLPSVSTGNDQEICKNDSTTISANGAVIYSWMPITGLVSPYDSITIAHPSITTTYTVTGTDANTCQAKDSITIMVHTLPIVYAGPDTIICAGEIITLNGSGASSYSWDNAIVNGSPFSPIASATYTVTGTDANTCQSTDSITILVNILPEIPIIMRNNDSIYTSNGYSYSWLLDGTVVTGENNHFISPVEPGTYVVEVTDSNGCKSTSAPFLILSKNSSLDDKNNLINIFPNPNKGLFKISFKALVEQQGKMEIYNILGENIYDASFECKDILLNIQDLMGGIYLIRIYFNDTEYIGKFIIK